MTPPCPPFAIKAAPSRPQRKVPVRLTSMTACHWARLIFSTSAPSFTLMSMPSRNMPAQLTSPCRAPSCSSMAAKVASTSGSSATLQTNRAQRPSRLRTSASVTSRSARLTSTRANMAP
ncbi:hypothetical protein D3C84_389420 [compost metagenome]